MEKIFLFFRNVSHGSFRASRLDEGAYRDRHETRGGMRWTLIVPTDERHVRVRPSRVVLARPCRRQVGGRCSTHHADDGGKQAGSPRRARSKPSNHCAGKAGVIPPPPAVVALSRTFFARGLRVSGGHPVFPAPSISRGRRSLQSPGARRAAGMRRCVFTLLFDN
jgi:hypothetical protein